MCGIDPDTFDLVNNMRRQNTAEITVAPDLMYISLAAAFFGLLSRRMDRLSTESFSEIWRSSLHQALVQMGEEEQRELEKLGGILGRYDLTEQLAAMKPILGRLRGILTELKEDFPVRRRLCLGVSCCLAAMLTLVLY